MKEEVDRQRDVRLRQVWIELERTRGARPGTMSTKRTKEKTDRSAARPAALFVPFFVRLVFFAIFVPKPWASQSSAAKVATIDPNRSQQTNGRPSFFGGLLELRIDPDLHRHHRGRDNRRRRRRRSGRAPRSRRWRL